MKDIVALVPIKSFTTAKGRLRAAIGDEATVALAKRLAGGVLRELHPLSITVVTDDPDVELFAREHGADVLRQRQPGLNGAVRDGYGTMASTSRYVVITHSDLARPEGLGAYPFDEGISIWTDRATTGTNVLCLPTGLDFPFAYGVNSSLAHRSAARALGFEPQWNTTSPWALDIDEPSDLNIQT